MGGEPSPGPAMRDHPLPKGEGQNEKLGEGQSRKPERASTANSQPSPEGEGGPPSAL